MNKQTHRTEIIHLLDDCASQLISVLAVFLNVGPTPKILSVY